MKFIHKTISYKTKEEFDFIDVTDGVKKFIEENDISNGLINIQTLHTTAGIIVNENEPLLIEDLKCHLEKISPKKDSYKHDDFSIRTVNMHANEPVNGHAHCKSTHLAVNVTLNLIDGKLQLGEWQRIFFIELDSSRDRNIQMVIMGE